MKNIILLVLAALISFATFAQNAPQKGKQKVDMTPEQVAELQTKKMTLQLDLTEAQQKKVHQLFKEVATEREKRRAEMQALREKGEKPSADAKYQMQKERLDAQIDHQNKMKKILDEKQYEIWKKNNEMRKDHFKGRMKDGGQKKDKYKKGNQ